MRALSAIILLLIGVGVSAPAAMGAPAPAYQGLGTWIDRYDAAAWAQPETTVRALAGRGVRTLFLQTANAKLPTALPPRERLDRFIDSAHRHRLKIVAWYAPDLCHLGRDQRRSLAAIRFRSAHGHRFDSFALDIESPCAHPVQRRNRLLLRLSHRLRRTVGRRYPLAAIIPSPRGMQLRANRYWPHFPFTGLHRYYDVFVLMTYFTYRTHGTKAVQDFTSRDIAILRREVRDPAVTIHSIGGEAKRATTADVRGFAAAVRAENVAGASLYDADATTRAMWRLLRRAVAPTSGALHSDARAGPVARPDMRVRSPDAKIGPPGLSPARSVLSARGPSVLGTRWMTRQITGVGLAAISATAADVPSARTAVLVGAAWLGSLLPDADMTGARMIGPPDAGKSQIARAIAYRLWTERGHAFEDRRGAPFYGFVEMQPGRSSDEFFFRHEWVPVAGAGGQVSLLDSAFVQAIRAGWVVMIDEVNSARDVCLLSINATLDGRLALYLSATGETVIARPGFAVILAYNPGLVGATDIPDAWQSRFPATLEVTSHWAALAQVGAPAAPLHCLDGRRAARRAGSTRQSD